MKMRTLPQVVEIIKKEDPESRLTLRGLRRLLNEGRIPYTSVGNMKLIDIDRLEDYLYQTPEAPKPPQAGQIRAIPE